MIALIQRVTGAHVIVEEETVGAIGPGLLALVAVEPDDGEAQVRRTLERLLDTPPQQQLDAATRRRNLRQAFALEPGSDVRGRHLALVDDVLTTGATAEALARLLKRAGAARVDVYCLARTPKPGD